MTLPRPGAPTAFEQLVEDYDAGRPSYPPELYDALPPLDGVRLLELGCGTGIATAPLVERSAQVVATDLGPRMLARVALRAPAAARVVARAEALPLRDGSFDAVCGAQMWHWVDLAPATAEVARVLRPGGWLALWWNEVDADGQPWWDAQQDRLEAGNPAYTRGYRQVDHGAALQASGLFTVEQSVQLPWARELDLSTYERWLRSKSYVQELPDVEEFVAASLDDLRATFPSGVVREPFRTWLWVARRR